MLTSLTESQTAACTGAIGMKFTQPLWLIGAASAVLPGAAFAGTVVPTSSDYSASVSFGSDAMKTYTCGTYVGSPCSYSLSDAFPNQGGGDGSVSSSVGDAGGRVDPTILATASSGSLNFGSGAGASYTYYFAITPVSPTVPNLITVVLHGIISVAGSGGGVGSGSVTLSQITGASVDGEELTEETLFTQSGPGRFDEPTLVSTEYEYAVALQVGAGAPGNGGSFAAAEIDPTITIDGPNAADYSIVYGPGVVPTGAVPEPATWAMMILGLGLVGSSMRRRAQPDLLTAQGSTNPK